MQPRVSVLIPARDEEDVIAQTVSCLLVQNYPDFEVLVLDDSSSDNTSEVALNAAGTDDRFKLIQGSALPDGWMGKSWACWQLSKHASGQILVFTDADVRWTPDALTAIVAETSRLGAEMVTIWPTQVTVSWAERLVVPLMAFSVMAYLPELCVRYVQWPVFSAAIGQCLVFRRKTYDLIGGHQTVKASVLDDMSLAWEAKRCGKRLAMVDANRLISCRMYRDWPSVRDGYTKNILAGHGGNPLLLLLSSVFHWMILLIPWLWLLFVWWSADWPWMPATMILLAIGIRALSAAATHQRVVDSMLIPLSTILMSLIALRAFWWHITNKTIRWKGRSLQQEA